MRPRPGLVAWVFLPPAVAVAGVARLLPEAGLWKTLAFLLVARFVATFALARGDRAFVPRRPLAVLRVLAIAALTFAFFPRADRAVEPVVALVTTVNAFACLWLLGPQGALPRFFLLLASAVQTIAVAHARPDADGLVQVLLYATALVPAILAFERAGWTAARGGSERGLRRVEAVGRGLGAAAFAGAVLRIAAIGLPVGVLAYAGAVLWAQPSRTRSDVGGLDGAGAVTPSAGGMTRDEVTTGIGMGSRLGVVSRVKRDPSPVLGVRPPNGLRRSGEPLYLRSAVYDRFSGTEWTTTLVPHVRRTDGDDGRLDDWIPLADGASATGGALRVRELRGGGHLHLPPEPDAVRFDAGGASARTVVRDGRSFRVLPTLEAGDAYEVRWRSPVQDVDALLAARSDVSVAPHPALVATPPEAEALRAFASRVVGGETRPAARAALLAEHLRSSYDYALRVAEADRRRPVHDFLLRTKRGNCEHFASAMTLLLRSLGHPARLAVGYRVDDESWLPFRGEYLVRASDAHAWTEAWFEGVGWVRFDATAPDRAAVDAPERGPEEVEEAADDRDLAERLIRPDDEDRRAVLERLGDALASLPWAWLAGAGAVAALALALVARRRGASAFGGAARPAAGGPAWDAYRRALRAYEREGVRRRPAETPSEFLAAASRAVPDAAEPFGRLTRRFEGERYGGTARDPGAGDAEASAVVAAVRGVRARRKAAAESARR